MRQPIVSSPGVTGIGGVFFRAADPEGLRDWYREHLGMDVGPMGADFLWRERDGSGVGRTVWNVFPRDTDYFGPGPQRFMVNYRVRDLDGLLASLREKGVRLAGEVEDHSYGRFAWVLDGEGNRVELWEPPEKRAFEPGAGPMISTELRQLLEHMEWADALVWKTVEGLSGAAEDPRLRELLHHVHTVQWVYLQLWRDEAVDVPELDAFDEPVAVRAWGRKYHRELAGFLDTLTPEDLDRTVEVPWAAQLVEAFGEVRPADVRQSMLQVALHSTYHRGQVNTRIRELGGEPPLTDFVAWIWAGRPVPAWPGGGEAGPS